MPFNILNFKSEISEYGYLQNNKFQLIVTPPKILLGKSLIIPSEIENDEDISISDVGQRLLFRGHSIVTPSVTLVLSDLNRFGMGITQKYPSNAILNTMTASFICDGRGILWDYFYQWIQSIFQFSGADSGYGSIINSSGNYTLGYKDDYSTVITVVIYDNYGNEVKSIDYTEAFPIGIYDIPLNWDSDNQLIKIVIPIAFTDYMIVGSTIQ